jgi:hypothetical protein
VHDERRNPQRAEIFGARTVDRDRHHLTRDAGGTKTTVVRASGAAADVVLVEPLGLRAVNPMRGDVILDVLVS